jgi:hypothetical protein
MAPSVSSSRVIFAGCAGRGSHRPPLARPAGHPGTLPFTAFEGSLLPDCAAVHRRRQDRVGGRATRVSAFPSAGRRPPAVKYPHWALRGHRSGARAGPDAADRAQLHGSEGSPRRLPRSILTKSGPHHGHAGPPWPFAAATWDLADCGAEGAGRTGQVPASREERLSCSACGTVPQRFNRNEPMTIALTLHWVAAALDGIAAVLWFISAAIRTPDYDKISTHVDQGGAVPLSEWARQTARWNKWAAAVTGLAILVQAISDLLSRPPAA